MFIKTDIPDGRIIVAACKDDCATNLSYNVKKWFARMGSREISKIGTRCAFAFIGVMGQTNANEKRGAGLNDQVQVT